MTILNQLQKITPKTYAAKFWCWATVINLHLFTTFYLRKLALVAEHENQTKIGYFHEDLDKTSTKLRDSPPSNYSNSLDSTQPACWQVVKNGNLLKSRDQNRMLNLSKSDPPDSETFENNLLPGVFNGCWAPSDCFNEQKLAVIIPYRSRSNQLTKSVYRLHETLQRQRRVYCIIVIEQYDLGQFNRGKLMNAGFIQCVQKFWSDYLNLVIFEVFEVKFSAKKLFSKIAFPARPTGSFY